MRFLTLALILNLTLSSNAQKPHGQGEEGTTMGPVQFLWPPDRPWDAANDNMGPCGSASGPTNRTIFPLEQGSVAIIMADDAWNVAFRLAVTSNPTKQSEFSDQVVSNITTVAPGHQCYKMGPFNTGIKTGQQATIQLEYWAEYEGENDGKNQSFFACADITFVPAQEFNFQIPCFNASSTEFAAPSVSTPPSTSQTPGLSTSQSASPDQGRAGGSGLSGGSKAGIAIGSVVGGLAVLGLLSLIFWRRGRSVGLKGKDEYELRAKDLAQEQPSSRL